MRKTFLVFSKEIRQLLNFTVNYIIAIIFLGISGWYFSYFVFIRREANLSPFFNIAPFLLLFLIPALTMRSIADEEKAGTIEVLSSMPLSHLDIILGKFLALISLFGIIILPTLIFPITLLFLGKIDIGPLFTSYIGLILIAISAISIGIFSSSLTKSAVGGYIIGFAILFFFFFIGKISPALPTGLAPFFDFLGFDSHYSGFIRGVMDTKDIIYLLSLAFLFLYLTAGVYRRYRDIPQRISNLILSFVIIVIINIFSFYLFFRFDFTKNHQYSLSPASIRIIRKSQLPIEIKAYISSDLPFPYNIQSKYVRDVLIEYKIRSRRKVKVKFIDPIREKKKREALNLGIAPLSFTETGASKYQVREGYMGLFIQVGPKGDVIPVVNNPSNLEYEITSRIKKMLSTREKKIVFLRGNMEIKPVKSIQDYLTKNYNLIYVNIAKDSIPDDADAIVINCPTAPFDSTALKKIDSAIISGKNLAIFLGKYIFDTKNFFAMEVKTNLDTIIHQFGLSLEDGIILDKVNQSVGIIQRRGIYNVTSYLPFPPIIMCKDLREFLSPLQNTIIPFASAIKGGKGIAYSSKRSWILKMPSYLNPSITYNPTKKAQMGPFPLISYDITKYISPFKQGARDSARIILCGTGMLTDKNFLSDTSVKLFLNLLDWIMESPDLISIRSKNTGVSLIKTPSYGGRIAFILINILLPIFIMVGYGITRWQRRKYALVKK